MLSKSMNSIESGLSLANSSWTVLPGHAKLYLEQNIDETRDMKKLILMAGVAGSGKSTRSHRYAKEHPNTYIIDTDDTRKSMTGSYLVFTDPVSLAWDEMIRQANEILAREQECTVILDSTFLTDERRLYFLSRLHGYDYLELCMVKFHDYSVVYQNNKARQKEKWVPEEVIDRMIREYTDPSPEVAKLFDKVTVEYWN